VETIKFLMERGGFDLNGVELFGMTPLHHAAMSCNGPAVRQLLRMGARRGIRTKKGKTAEEMARESDANAAILLLLSRAKTM
jgi:ankyrin repeat protein